MPRQFHNSQSSPLNHRRLSSSRTPWRLMKLPSRVRLRTGYVKSAVAENETSGTGGRTTQLDQEEAGEQRMYAMITTVAAAIKIRGTAMAVVAGMVDELGTGMVVATEEVVGDEDADRLSAHL